MRSTMRIATPWQTYPTTNDIKTHPLQQNQHKQMIMDVIQMLVIQQMNPWLFQRRSDMALDLQPIDNIGSLSPPSQPPDVEPENPKC